ncbi:MAG: HDOD domain-containing protein [Gammaproteobacteria bacterium]|nr:HDOD domain-containing protein [Gammaproteobacteria bacterium]
MTTAFDNELEQVTELISLPEVYLKIHALMDDSKSDIDDFARVIKLDPNLTAKLLKAANSAYFGFSGEINDISRAVYLMGIQQLHIMVLSISAVTAVSSLDFPKDIVDLKTFWRSSLLAGALSKLLAQQLSIRPGERFFILGLLHEIGHLVLYAKFPQLAREISELAQTGNMRIDQAERELLGCHYGNIGARLMKKWKLPISFQTMTNYQPTPDQAPEDKIEASILHIAHAYARRQYSENNECIENLIAKFAWHSTQLTTEQVEQNLQAALLISGDMERVVLRP